MIDERTAEVLTQCEENGLAWAKVFIQGQENSHYGLDVRYWIAERERRDQADRDGEQRRLAEAAIAEAKRAADVSRDAAVASQTSARWTMIAAIAAAASATIPVLQGFGWLPK